MKTYTFSWRAHKWNKENALCRFLLRDCSAVTAVEFFVWELSRSSYEYKPYSRPHSFRLSSCGRLVARSATYQGV